MFVYSSNNDRCLIVPKNGYLDLSALDSLDNKIVKLKKNWAFNWEKFIDPKNSDRVPYDIITDLKHWFSIKYNGDYLPEQGFATYRMTVKLPEKTPILAFEVKSIHTAFDMYINEEKVFSSGKISKSKEGAVPKYNPNYFVYNPKSTEMRILIHVSNYHHKKGGFVTYMQFGEARNIISLY